MVDPVLLSEVVVVWTGWGETAWPARDEERVAHRFGGASAAELMPEVRKLVDNFYASDARFVVADLKAMGDAAAADFRRLHPDITYDAVAALAWCYSFDYK